MIPASSRAQRWEAHPPHVPWASTNTSFILCCDITWYSASRECSVLISPENTETPTCFGPETLVLGNDLSMSWPRGGSHVHKDAHGRSKGGWLAHPLEGISRSNTKWYQPCPTPACMYTHTRVHTHSCTMPNPGQEDQRVNPSVCWDPRRPVFETHFSKYKAGKPLLFSWTLFPHL